MDRDLALIRLLADGRPHSAEVLAERSGSSHAELDVALRGACERFDLALVSLAEEGYRLERALELLDIDRLSGALPASVRAAVARLEIHPQIDSTNRHLLGAVASGAPSGTLCLAEQQTAGRGRLGRTWVSPFGVNLYLSILWRFGASPAALGGFSLVAGAVVAEVLDRLGVEGLALKWPNDLMWRRRKVGGILAEVSGEARGPCALVVGVGINLGMSLHQGRAIEQPWVDLSDAVAGAPPSRHRLAAGIIAALVQAAGRFEREGLAPYLDLWNRFDGFRGESVRLVAADRVIRGTLIGIAPDGAVRLATAEGERTYHAGELSLRSDDEGGVA